MSLVQTHLDIARERFLELMAEEPGRSVTQAVDEATLQADTFIALYIPLALDQKADTKKLKGCRACHGSGGKASDPCKACGGTGKVSA